ncbi:MAG: hypothetical protein LBG60_13420, partial [Bifidobacteriaceae bacterium]|nr:hypothetical protein [Bifidobacteriaceae bacterium]
RATPGGLKPGDPGWDDPHRWRIEINPHHGYPQLIPPARVDPARTPILHARFRVKPPGPGRAP